jgi:hypothetical protein
LNIFGSTAFGGVVQPDILVSFVYSAAAISLFVLGWILSVATDSPVVGALLSLATLAAAAGIALRIRDLRGAGQPTL